jgi:hypothetical protein
VNIAAFLRVCGSRRAPEHGTMPLPGRFSAIFLCWSAIRVPSGDFSDSSTIRAHQRRPRQPGNSAILCEPEGPGSISVNYESDGAMSAWASIAIRNRQRKGRRADRGALQHRTLQACAKTTKPFAGMTMLAEAGRPCMGESDATVPPPLPATIGLTQLS